MKTKIAEFLADYIPSLSKEEIEQLIETPPTQDMGDLAFPCFRLAKSYHKAPAMIASELTQSMQKPEFISDIQAAGPYINFYLNRAEYAGNTLKKIVSADDYGHSDEGEGKTICMDYSSPNIAKNFHVGHLRTTIIGNSIYKIFSKLGYKVVRINHLGDWGTQFGKLIVAYKRWGSKEEVEKKGIQELMDLYVRFHEEAETDDTLNDEARAAFAEMEHGNEEYLKIWEWFKEISMKEFMRVYDMLDVQFDAFTGESFYRNMTPEILDMLRQDHLLVESEGALVVPLDEYDMPPCIVAKSDGSSIYATRDLAAVLYRKKTYDFTKCLYVTGLEQKLHFKQIFKVIELMGYDFASGLVHVPYGLVSLKSGKISSRKGNVIYAEDILNESINKTKTIISEKNPNLENKDQVAHDVGIGAIIFNDLYNQRIKDVTFDWDKLLNFDGETGPYVQYTHARAASVLRKAGYDEITKDDIRALVGKADFNVLTDDASIALIKELDRYPTVIKSAAEKYEPSVVARYSMDVAHAFNTFYRDNQVIVDDDKVKTARLALFAVTKEIIKDSLSLLGIHSPERM